LSALGQTCRPIPIPNAIAILSILFIHVRQTHAGYRYARRFINIDEQDKRNSPKPHDAHPLGKTSQNEPHAHPLARVQDAKNAKNGCEANMTRQA
jgi:hypothetical protein